MYLYLCIHVRIYICADVYLSICTYVCMYVYICIYVYMYVCICVYVYVITDDCGHFLLDFGCSSMFVDWCRCPQQRIPSIFSGMWG